MAKLIILIFTISVSIIFINLVKFKIVKSSKSETCIFFGPREYTAGEYTEGDRKHSLTHLITNCCHRYPIHLAPQFIDLSVHTVDVIIHVHSPIHNVYVAVPVQVVSGVPMVVSAKIHHNTNI